MKIVVWNFQNKILYCLHHKITNKHKDNFVITMTEKSKTYCLLTIMTLKIKPKMNISKK